MTKAEHLEFLSGLEVGDQVCCSFIYAERNIVRTVVECTPNKAKTSYLVRADGGKRCSNCGRVGTPINGFYGKGVDGEYIHPVL